MNSTTQIPPCEAVWFFGGLTYLKATAAETDGRMMIIENIAPRGVGSPLHVHHNEDEWFYVLEGELTIWHGGTTVVAGPGDFVFGPRDVPHTFIVSSDQARFLLGTQPGNFERFVRELCEPAATETLPPVAAPPDMEKLMAVAAELGIEILGPPGIPE